MGTANIEGVAVLPERPAVAADDFVRLENLSLVPLRLPGNDQAHETAAQNSDLHLKRARQMRFQVHQALCSGCMVLSPIRGRYGIVTTLTLRPSRIGRKRSSTGNAAPTAW